MLLFFFAGLKRKVRFAFDNAGKAQLLVFKQSSCGIGYLNLKTGNLFYSMTFGFNSGLLSSEF